MQINCLTFVQEVKTALASQIQQLAHPLRLVVVNVGDDPASKSYIKNKVKIGTELGISVDVHELPGDTTQDALLTLLGKLNGDPEVHGIIVQLPLPNHLEAKTITNAIDPRKDVDCLTDANYGQFLLDRHPEPGLAPCTALGIYELLKWQQFPLAGANAVVINRSEIVGRPLAHLLLNANATVTICHRQTRDWRQFSQIADLVVLGVGHPNFLRQADVKPGTTIIDVSINRGADRKLCGDATYTELVQNCAITPVPGGIGPITVVMIFRNLLYLYQVQQAGKMKK